MEQYTLDEYPALQRWTTRCRAAMAAVAVISGIMTFRGLKAYGMGGNDGLFQSFFGPLLLTSVSVLIAMFGFSYVFERYPRARTPETRYKLRLVIVFISIVLISTSTWFSLVGLASTRCLERSLQSGLLEAERVFDELVAVRRSEKSMLTPLQLGAGQSTVLVKNEQGGGLSGRKGKGRIASNLRGLQRGYQDIADTLENNITDNEAAATEGQLILEEIRGILNDDKLDVKKKSALIVPLFNALNAQLAALQLSSVPAVTSFVQNIDEVYLSEGTYMSSVLDVIRKPVEKTKQEILKQVTQIRRQKEPVVPRFHVIDAEQAIFQYPDAVWASLVYAVSLDIGFPLMCLSFLIILGRKENNFRTARGLSHGHFMQTAAAGASFNPAHESLWRTNNSKDHQGNKSRSNRGNGQESPVA